jgi:hypothetical protein
MYMVFVLILEEALHQCFGKPRRTHRLYPKNISVGSFLSQNALSTVST